MGEIPAPYDQFAREDTLLRFHRPSCHACRAMLKEVELLAALGRLRPVDVAQHVDGARALSVMATPPTVRLRGGRTVPVRTGVLRRADLEALGA